MNAQTPAANPPQAATGLEEVTVTAERKKESLQEAPVAVTAITATSVKDMDIRSQETMQLLTPSMTWSSQIGFPQVYIRGIGTNYPDPGLESPVALYQDDIYITGGLGTQFDIVDPESVQVLNGPQGTLYGRNASGGVILINSANPTDHQEGSINAEFGRFDHRQFDLMWNQPITDDLRVRIAGRSLDDGGYIHDVTTGHTLGGESNYTVRVKIDWTPEAIPGLDLLWMTEYGHYHEYHDWVQEMLYSPLCLGCGANNAGRPVGFYDTTQNLDRPFEDQYWLNNLHATYDVGDYTIKSITSYRNARFLARGSDQDFTSADLFAYYSQSPDWTYTEDLSIASNYGGRFDFITGIYYLRENRDFTAGLGGGTFEAIAAGLGLPNTFPINQDNIRTDTYSGFFQGTLKLTDDISFTGGARYNVDHRVMDTHNNAAGTIIFGTPGVRQSGTWYSLTPRFVLTWKTDYGDFYVSDTKGFKAGGFSTPAFANPPIVAPEKNHSEEMGLKSTWLDNRLRTSIDVFHYKAENLQVSVTDVLKGGQVTENAGSEEGTGVEFNGQFRANDELLLGFGGDYLHAHFVSFRNPALYCPTSTGLVNCPTNAAGLTYDPVTGSPLNASGSVLPHSPEFQGYVTADYQVPVFEGWNGNVDVLAHWTDRFKFFTLGGGPLNYDKTNAYWVVNINAYLMSDDEKYRIGFYIDNALNTKYVDFRETSGPYGAYDMAAAPLTFGVKLGYKFSPE